MDRESQANIALIKSCGYRVFMRPTSDTYCYYTDGTRIGYAQWSQIRVTSVHVANSSSGTGYIVAEDINPYTLKQALDTIRPPKFSDPMPTKYRDWDHFHNSSEFNKQLVEV